MNDSILNRLRGLKAKILERRNCYRREFRYTEWDRVRRTRGFIDYEIATDLSIRLHYDSALARLVYCEEFEKTELQFVRNYLREGDIFIDVGANIGLFTLLASDLVGDSGLVIAFEPAEKAVIRLRENLSLNKGIHNVTVIRAGLSDADGYLDLRLSTEGFDAWNTLGAFFADGDFRIETVSVMTLSSFLKERQLPRPVTMIKIDVEGWESRVLSGGEKYFRSSQAPLLQVEFTDIAAESCGSSCSHLYKQLVDFGYQINRYDLSSNQLIPDPIRDEYPYNNLFACKDAGEVNRRLRRGCKNRVAGPE